MARKSQTVVVVHCAVFGRFERRVKSFEVGSPQPLGEYPVGVLVSFVEPRQRRAEGLTIVADNTRFVTVEDRGRVLYDSRSDVPCDMAAWEQTRAQFYGTPGADSSPSARVLTGAS